VQKPKRVKDSAYHKKKMLLCKQAEQGVPLQAEQYDWLADMNEENDQNDVESDDERVALANLIANLKLNVNENKKIQKQLKKANTTLAQELKEYKTILAKTKCDCLAQKLSKQTESVSKKVHTELLQHFAKVEKHSISLDFALQNCKEQGKAKSVDNKFDRQYVVQQPNAQRIPKPSVLGKPTPFSDSLERRYFPKTKSVSKANVLEGLLKSVTAQTLPKTAKKAE
nr:hypothetical protein [Tanacetum cinerariifolium]